MAFAEFSGINTPITANFKLPNVKLLNEELKRQVQQHIITEDFYFTDMMDIESIKNIDNSKI